MHVTSSVQIVGSEHCATCCTEGNYESVGPDKVETINLPSSGIPLINSRILIQPFPTADVRLCQKRNLFGLQKCPKIPDILWNGDDSHVLAHVQPKDVGKMLRICSMVRDLPNGVLQGAELS